MANDASHKLCGRCGAPKPVEEFHLRGSSRQSWCKPCRRAYDAAYHRSTRDLRLARKRKRIADHVAWMRALKDKPCTDCRGSFHPAAMTFDHLPGSIKVHDIATLVRRGSIGLAKLEIEKCEVVCANCHAIRTFERRRLAA